MVSQYKNLYLKILEEETSPTTFTPEELLNDIRNKCYFSTGEYIVYSINDILKFCDDINKPLFSTLVKNLNNIYDYAMIIVYFSDINQLDELFNTYGYFNPHQNYKQFSMKAVYKQFKQYFQNPLKTASNFNSIDVCPELGCIIGINGANICGNREFEKQLDHELNHYFEKMQIYFNNIDQQSFKIKSDNISKKVIKQISDFYQIDLTNKSSFIDDLKYHFFNESEFRSMSANIFHDILSYNEKHLKQLNFHEFIDDIANCNYQKYDEISLQESILFSWTCKQLSQSRWDILVQGIKAAIKLRKNIFQKFLIKVKDYFQKLLKIICKE